MRISDWSSDVCSSDLDVDDIPFLQHFRAGNAVADDVIDRGADRLRERRTSAAAAVVQRCRDAVQRADDVLVADAVQLVGGNARFDVGRSEEHTSELQSLMRISYAVFCLKKKTTLIEYTQIQQTSETRYHRLIKTSVN